jgi:hypothetical protein
MGTFARIVVCGALASGLLFGVASTAGAVNYMYDPPTSEQLLESQKREADLAAKLAEQEAANATLESQVKASNDLNKSLTDANAGLTSRLGSAESSIAALTVANDKETAALEKELAELQTESGRLQQAATAGPFDFSDTGHALVALTALLIGGAVTAASAYAISRGRGAGNKRDTEPVSPE